MPRLPPNLRVLNIHPGRGYGTDLSSLSIDWESFIGTLAHLTNLRLLTVASIVSDPHPSYEARLALPVTFQAPGRFLPSLKECNVHGSVRFHRAFTLLIDCKGLKVPGHLGYVSEARAWPQVDTPNLTRLRVSFDLITGSQLADLLGNFGRLSCFLQVEETEHSAGAIPVETGLKPGKLIKLPPYFKLEGIPSLRRMVHILSFFGFEETKRLGLDSSSRMTEVDPGAFANTHPISMPRLHELGILLEGATPVVLMKLDRFIKAPRLRSLSAPGGSLGPDDHLVSDHKGHLNSITRLDLYAKYVERIIPLATNVRLLRILLIPLGEGADTLGSLIWPSPGVPESGRYPMLPHLDELTFRIFGDESSDGIFLRGISSLAQEIADSRKRVGKPLKQLVLETLGEDGTLLPIAELGSDGAMRRGMRCISPHFNSMLS